MEICDRKAQAAVAAFQPSCRSSHTNTHSSNFEWSTDAENPTYIIPTIVNRFPMQTLPLAFQGEVINPCGVCIPYRPFTFDQASCSEGMMAARHRIVVEYVNSAPPGWVRPRYTASRWFLLRLSWFNRKVGKATRAGKLVTLTPLSIARANWKHGSKI